jgi:hypothetical protein
MRNSANFSRLSGLTVLAVLAALAGFGNRTAAAYLTSAHGGNSVPGAGVLRSSVSGKFAVGNCGHCHEQHASIDGNEPAPDNDRPSRYLLLDDLAGNAACNHCHDISGQNNADNIASQIGKNSRHDPNSSKVGTGQQPQCNVCHDSHVAQIGNHQEGVDGNNVMGPLLSVAGVTVASWPIPGVPAAGFENLNSPALSALDPITMEWELCLSCHGGQSGYTLKDERGVFNPNNFSVHPVTSPVGATAWQNTWLWTNYATAFNAPWNALANRDKPMYCSDCHGSDNSAVDPVGPHGSNNSLILKLGGTGGGTTCPDNLYLCNADYLCLKCHVDPATNSSWVDNPGYPLPNTPLLVGDHTYFGHQSMATNAAGTNPLGCLACHGDLKYSVDPMPAIASNIHGANYVGNSPTLPADPGRPSYAFLVSSFINFNYYIGIALPPNRAADALQVGNRWCQATCHTLDAGVGYAY